LNYEKIHREVSFVYYYPCDGNVNYRVLQKRTRGRSKWIQEMQLQITVQKKLDDVKEELLFV